MTNGEGTGQRPPSVDALARTLARDSGLPHAVLVDCARRAVRERPADCETLAADLAREMEVALMTDVINATGVLLHTNLGRAPLVHEFSGRASNVEMDLATGERGSRHAAISRLVSLATGADAALVVNNNAAAVMLVLAALAHGRDVAVSRGESVEIGGGFRIPDVMEQSGARLIDVGTTNRTRLKDYAKALESRRNDVALVMKVHPSNFAISGFTEQTSVGDLASLGVPVVADIGSGLLDNECPWLHGHTDGVPAWLSREPAAAQALRDGAALVTFSGDKLLGGPQCGIIAGRGDLIEACASHPLMRALRPGGHALAMLQRVLVSFLARTACEEIPFWTMVATRTAHLEARARAIAAATADASMRATPAQMQSIVGAGSAPGGALESFGLVVDGDHRTALRASRVPIIARTNGNSTRIDLRTVRPEDDHIVVDALLSLKG